MWHIIQGGSSVPWILALSGAGAGLYFAKEQGYLDGVFGGASTPSIPSTQVGVLQSHIYRCCRHHFSSAAKVATSLNTTKCTLHAIAISQPSGVKDTVHSATASLRISISGLYMPHMLINARAATGQARLRRGEGSHLRPAGQGGLRRRLLWPNLRAARVAC